MRRVSLDLIFTPLVAQGAEVVDSLACSHQAAVMEMGAFLELQDLMIHKQSKNLDNFASYESKYCTRYLKTFHLLNIQAWVTSDS